MTVDNFPSVVSQVVKAGVIKKKILFVIDTLQVGGAEQSLLDNLSRFKHIQPVVCHLYKGDYLKQRFQANNIRVYSIGLTAKFGFYSGYKSLKAIVAKEQPDLLVGYLTRSEIVTRLVARSTKIPVVGTFVSDLYGKSYNQNLSYFSKLAVSFFKLVNKLTASFCAGFVANSKAIQMANAAWLQVPVSKIEVIHRGRDSDLFPAKQTGREQKNTRFLNVGRLVPVKGQGLLIVSFINFLKVYPNAILDIAGDGPEHGSLAALIKEFGVDDKIRLLGNVQDIPHLLQGYDCFVFPSFSEGFSGAVVEAMMAGLPVLASNIPANEEVIKHLETGYLFDAKSAESITHAMFWFCANPTLAASLAQHARTYALQHFELDQIAEKLETYLCKKMVPAVV